MMQCSIKDQSVAKVKIHRIWRPIRTLVHTRLMKIKTTLNIPVKTLKIIKSTEKIITRIQITEARASTTIPNLKFHASKWSIKRLNAMISRLTALLLLRLLQSNTSLKTARLLKPKWYPGRFKSKLRLLLCLLELMQKKTLLRI